ncbi:hypothetical protein [Rhodospirillaceae bacterium SYSU D60014]|uniref:hypothetical protein n=1 Tax=Virgifigura deserti TaxID=2268457 RepID=UPI000E6632B9
MAAADETDEGNEVDQGKVTGQVPQADRFETTLRGKPNQAYAGCRLRFLTGGLVRFSRDVTDYDGASGVIVVDDSFPTPPEPGDDFVIERP